MTKLMGFQYKIIYRKGTTNCAADALSRMTHNSSVLSALSVALPTWLQSVQKSYDNQPSAQQLLQSLAVQNPQGHYSLDQGIIKYKNAIWLGHSNILQNTITEQLHSSPIGGHSGFLVTYKRVKKIFYWPHMKDIV